MNEQREELENRLGHYTVLDFSDRDSIKLSELFNTRNGYTPSKHNTMFWENGELPWFRMEDIRANGRILSDALQHITMEAAKNKPFPANSIIVSTTATIGEHALITEDFLCNQQFTCLSLKDKYKKQYDMKFLFYYCFKLDEYCLQNLNQGNFASVNMTKFGRFKFPVISLQEQREIVRILDKFTELETELETELQLRKKQYEYYRDQLLTFRGGGTAILTFRRIECFARLQPFDMERGIKFQKQEVCILYMDVRALLDQQMFTTMRMVQLLVI